MDWQIFWTVLGGAFGGALIGSLATILVTRMNHNHQHRQWLREEKLIAYVDFIRTVQTLFNKTTFENKTVEDAQKMVDNISNTLARIDLLAPASVTDKSSEVRSNLTDNDGSEKSKLYKKSLTELKKAMRDDIHKSKSQKDK